MFVCLLFVILAPEGVYDKHDRSILSDKSPGNIFLSFVMRKDCAEFQLFPSVKINLPVLWDVSFCCKTGHDVSHILEGCISHRLLGKQKLFALALFNDFCDLVLTHTFKVLVMSC